MRIIKRALSFLFILFLFSKNINAQLLWEISGNELTESSYLFGTIHIPDKRAYEFNDSVFAKIEECDAFAMEVVMTEENEKLMENVFQLKEGQTLKSFYSKKDYKYLTTALKEKLDIDINVFESLHPAVVELGLMYLQIQDDMETTVDEYLHDFAKTKNKKTLSIEPIQTQIDLFKDEPPEGLVDYMKNWEKYNDMLEEMILTYQKEDLDKVLAMVLDETLKKKQDKLIWERNVTMTDSIDIIIHRQPTFVAIGTGHLPGEGGVIDLLEKKGYQLKPIIASKTLAPKIEKPVDFSQWKTIDNKDGAFSIKMPVEPDYEKIEQPTEIGSIELHFFTAENTNDENVYSLMYSDYPMQSINSEVMSPEMLEAFYERCINAGAGGMKGEVAKIDDILWGSYNAKVGQISINGGQDTVGYYIYLIKNRLYLGQVISSSFENNQRAEHFVQSFKITDNYWTTPFEPAKPVKPAEWELVESKEGKFSALMFGIPEESIEREETAAGEIIMTFLTSESFDADGKELATSVLYIDFPIEMANSDSMSVEELSSFYSNTVTNALGGQNSKLLFKKETTLSGLQALRYKGATEEEDKEMFINAGLLLVKNRLYLLQYITDSNQPHETEVDKFFKSFRLIKSKK